MLEYSKKKSKLNLHKSLQIMYKSPEKNHAVGEKNTIQLRGKLYLFRQNHSKTETLSVLSHFTV